MTATQMIGVTSTWVSRAERMAMPLAREVVRDVAVEHGACIRPVQLRRRNIETGEVDQVLVPCGHTLTKHCPVCADRAKTLRAAQCREGWHLEDEPGIQPDPATEDQKWRIMLRAETQQLRDQAEAAGNETTGLDELITELDAEITAAGIRGKAAPARPKRRHRSTRRRQDAPDLPKRTISPRTIGKDDEPHHVTRFGERFDAQGVLAGSKDAARCIGYLTKQVGDCHHAEADAERAHAARLAEALRFEPCSPTCSNWLRYGVQPKNARPGLVPGCCKGKAHDADHLGYAGRPVLVSRKWSGKTLADHRVDRQQWLLSMLDIPATDPARYAWELVEPGDPDHMDHARRLLHAVADRARWQAALAEARRPAAIQAVPDPSATGRAA